MSVFTVLTLVTVKVPSRVSLAVAPASLYVPLASTVSVALPNRVITGLVVSTTSTVRVTVSAAFPLASLTLVVTL